MNDGYLPLTQDFQSGSQVSRENITLVRQTNRHLDLGFDPQTLSNVSRARQLCGWSTDCDFLSAYHVHGLLYDMEDNGGRPVDREARADAKLFRRFGWDALERIIDDLFDLIKVMPLAEVFSPDGLAEMLQSKDCLRKSWRPCSSDGDRRWRCF